MDAYTLSLDSRQLCSLINPLSAWCKALQPTGCRSSALQILANFLRRPVFVSDEATHALLCALALMPRLTRLSLGLWIAAPPPAGLVMQCLSGATAGPHLTALELSQISP